MRADNASAAAGGIACLPRGVGAFAPRPFFYLYVSNFENVGHTLWDDVVPVVAAAHVLGLQFSDFDLLLSSVGCCEYRWPATAPPWGGDQGTRALFNYLSPNFDPAQLWKLSEEAGSDLVLFPRIAGGLTGHSPHNFRPTMRVFGAEVPVRSVWRARSFLFAQMGLAAEGARSVRELPRPEPGMEARLVLVKTKRDIVNRDELLGGLRTTFPNLLVEDLAWQDLGGLREEARRVAEVSILVTQDGTASANSFFLPEGAAFVSLGVARAWGSQSQCDFMHASLDHVRVLYYDRLEPGEHDGQPFSTLRIPPAKLAPFVHQALNLTRHGFAVPTAETENHDGNAALTRFLFERYPEFAWMGIDMWVDYVPNSELGHKMSRMKDGAPAMYRHFVGREPPASLAEDIAAYCARAPCGYVPHEGVPPHEAAAARAALRGE